MRTYLVLLMVLLAWVPVLSKWIVGEVMVESTGIPFATYYQDVKMNEVLQKRPRVLVLDPWCGLNGRPWTKEELQKVENTGVKPIAYLPVCVVAEYHPTMYREAERRSLLGVDDPEWPGDYAVKFWEPAWRNVLRSELVRFKELGFEGVFLDVVDAHSHSWYVRWYDRVNPHGDLRKDELNAVKWITRTAHGLGLHVMVNAGAWAFEGDDMARLQSELGFALVVESVISDGSGRLYSRSKLESNLRALSRFQGPVYVIEYGLDPDNPNVRKAAERLFDGTRATCVYITSVKHDGIGVALVPFRKWLWDVTLGPLLGESLSWTKSGQ
ncbi:endo alpha-1,4 polygalactosaminidase [Methanopyrus sp. KOL6]|uniref:endo alpha-1,4 polygalactosaminidase n=1 Tax=Methanopyrus sp. KOL6 TaxID=1937004 RepID=UPI000B4AE006|nr:endo alpha-1,4 polygalactosaminidase [Methanopyrus sp. KOL6]